MIENKLISVQIQTNPFEYRYSPSTWSKKNASFPSCKACKQIPNAIRIPNEQKKKKKKQNAHNGTITHERKFERKSTLTVIFPPLYSLSSSGSRAGKRENSNPSMSFQSSACPSRVMIPGRNSATIPISESDSQLHSPDSWWDLTGLIGAKPERSSRARRRGIISC